MSDNLERCPCRVPTVAGRWKGGWWLALFLMGVIGLGAVERVAARIESPGTAEAFSSTPGIFESLSAPRWTSRRAPSNQRLLQAPVAPARSSSNRSSSDAARLRTRSVATSTTSTSGSGSTTSSTPQFLSLQFSLWNNPDAANDDLGWDDSVRLRVAISRALLQQLCTQTPQMAAVENEQDAAPPLDETDDGDMSAWIASDDNACHQFATHSGSSGNSDGSRHLEGESSFLRDAQSTPLFAQSESSGGGMQVRDATAVIESKEKGPGSEKNGLANILDATAAPSSSSAGGSGTTEFSIVLADPYMGGQEKSDAVGHLWTVWTVTYKVFSVGEYYREQVVASHNGTTRSDDRYDQASAEGGLDLAALEIMRQLIQTALDVSLGEGRFNFALQQVIPQELHSSPVGQEAQRFADLPVQTSEAPSRPWSGARIAGITIMVFIIFACFVVAFLACRRSQLLLKHPLGDDTSSGNDESLVDIYVAASARRPESQAASSLSRLSKSYCFPGQQEGDIGRMVAPPTILHLPTGPGGLLDSSANMDIDSSDDDRSVLSPTTGFLLCRKRPFKEEQKASVSRPKPGVPALNACIPRNNFVNGNSLVSSNPEMDEIEIDVDTGELLGVATISSSIASHGAPQAVLQAMAPVPTSEVPQMTPQAFSTSQHDGNDDGEVKTTGETTPSMERESDDTIPDSVSLSLSSTSGRDTVFDGKDLVVPSDPETNEEPGLHVPRPKYAVLHDCLSSDDPVALSQPMNNDLHTCSSDVGSNCAASLSPPEQQKALAQNDSVLAHVEPARTEEPLPTEELDTVGSVALQVFENLDDDLSAFAANNANRNA